MVGTTFYFYGALTKCLKEEEYSQAEVQSQVGFFLALGVKAVSKSGYQGIMGRENGQV
jgi:hypothetical protein